MPKVLLQTVIDEEAAPWSAIYWPNSQVFSNHFLASYQPKEIRIHWKLQHERQALDDFLVNEPNCKDLKKRTGYTNSVHHYTFATVSSFLECKPSEDESEDDTDSSDSDDANPIDFSDEEVDNAEFVGVEETDCDDSPDATNQLTLFPIMLKKSFFMLRISVRNKLAYSVCPKRQKRSLPLLRNINKSHNPSKDTPTKSKLSLSSNIHCLKLRPNDCNQSS